MITRFDDMASSYAALVWDFVLPMSEIDEALLFEFYASQRRAVQPGEAVRRSDGDAGSGHPGPDGHARSDGRKLAGSPGEHRERGTRRDHGALADRPAASP